MTIHWVYFSDKNHVPEEIKTVLARQKFDLTEIYLIEKLQGHVQDNQTVLFIDAHTNIDVYDLCQEISALYPHVYIILIVPEEMENLRKAMLAGASDTLSSSYHIEELNEAVAHAKKFMHHRAQVEPNFTSLVKESSKVIALSSPKGGIGRTMISVNLAIAFAKLGKRVAVIDGNLQFGEVPIFYNSKPKRTIYEWVKEGYGRPNYSISQYMTMVDGDVSVLAAPSRPEFFEGISENHIKEAIEELKELFDIILIDMPAHLSEIHLRFLDLADEILILTVNELSVLRLSRLYLDTLETIQQKEKVNLILNRYSKGQGLEPNRMEEVLGIKVFHTLPDQINVASKSIKAGEPFMLGNSRSHLGKAVWQLAERLLEQKNGVGGERKKDKRWFLIGK